MKTRNNVVKMGVVASAAVLALGGLVGPADAGIIIGTLPGFGSAGATSGGVSAQQLPVTTNNDVGEAELQGVTNPNRVSLATTLTQSTGFVDTTFIVSNSGGQREYYFTDVVTNNSGGRIGSYHYSLIGFGPTLPVDFDAPNYDPDPNGAPYLGININSPTYISFVGSSIPATLGATNTFNFSIDIPDTLDPAASYSFTLRAVPNPEPGTWAMMAIGLIGLAAAAWRRKKQDSSWARELSNLA